MKWDSTWDLSSIPDDVFRSEIGRRTRPRAPNLKLEPCKHCNALLSARQRRRACVVCGKRQSEVATLSLCCMAGYHKECVYTAGGCDCSCHKKKGK